MEATHITITEAQWAAIGLADYCVVGDPEFAEIAEAASRAGITLPAAGLVEFEIL